MECVEMSNSDRRPQREIVMQPSALIEHAWYRLMATYGTDDKGEIHANDADDLIVPTLIASLIVPALVHLVRYDWNPYSAPETKQLLMQVNTAWQHLRSYHRFADDKKPLLVDAIKERCTEAISDLLSCSAIPSWVLTKIMPKNFKQIATKPLDVLDLNVHEKCTNLPGGAMYEYVKNRVFNAVQLLQNVSVLMLQNELDDNNECTEWLLQVTRNIYHSVIEPFVTFMVRSPAKHAKEDMNAQMEILRDLKNIFEKFSTLQKLWKQNEECENDDDDEDIRMKSEIRFPDSITKHIQRSLSEINNNINDSIREHENVIQILNSLHNLCIHNL